MERDRTQLALVESAVSAAVARLQPKLEFWGTGAETPETNWERPGALGEESLEGLFFATDATTPFLCITTEPNLTMPPGGSVASFGSKKNNSRLCL